MTTIDEIGRRWMDSYRGPSRQRCRTAYRRWLTWCVCNDVAPAAPERVDVQRWVHALTDVDGLAPRTAAGYAGAICRMFELAHVDGLIPYHPGAHIRRPAAPRRSNRIAPRRGEAALILDAAEAHSATADALVCLLTLTGTRLGETLALDIDDIDAGTVWVVTFDRRKNGDPGRVALAERTGTAIARAIGGRSDGPLLVEHGRRLTASGARRIIREVTGSVGLDHGYTPHSFRHAFATLALDAGATEREIMATGGWRDPAMIHYYDRSRDGVDHPAVHKVAAWITGDRSNPDALAGLSERDRRILAWFAP